MLKGLAVMFAVLAGLQVPLYGQTPSVGIDPCSQQKQDGKNDTTQAKNDQRGTPCSPLVVKVNPTPKSDTETAEDKRENDHKEFIDRWTLRFACAVAVTAVLQVVGIGLQVGIFVRQTAIMGQHGTSLEQLASAAANNARAAALSAQAILDSERPWIVVSVESPERNIFVFKATNVGKTPAIITSVCPFMVPVSRTDRFKVSPQFESGENMYFAALPLLLPPTASHVFFRRNVEDLDKRQSTDVWMRQLAQGIFTVFSYGKIIYSDTLKTGEPHETVWCYIHFPLEGALPVPDPMHPEYNKYS